MDTIAIGHYLSSLREKKGLTQVEVASRLMVSNRAVSKWECGEGLPSHDLLLSLASFYGVTVDEILRAGETVAPARGGNPSYIAGHVVLEVFSLLLSLTFSLSGVAVSTQIDVISGFALALSGLLSGLAFHLLGLWAGSKAGCRFAYLEAFATGLVLIDLIAVLLPLSTVPNWGNSFLMPIAIAGNYGWLVYFLLGFPLMLTVGLVLGGSLKRGDGYLTALLMDFRLFLGTAMVALSLITLLDLISFDEAFWAECFLPGLVSNCISAVLGIAFGLLLLMAKAEFPLPLTSGFSFAFSVLAFHFSAAEASFTVLDADIVISFLSFSPLKLFEIVFFALAFLFSLAIWIFCLLGKRKAKAN